MQLNEMKKEGVPDSEPMPGFRSLVARKPYIISLVTLLVGALWVGSGQFFHPEAIGQTNVALLSNVPSDVFPEVVVEKMYEQPVTLSLKLPGQTAPSRVVKLKAETRGIVTSISARRGSRVEIGEPILHLDTRGLQEQLASATTLLKERQLAVQGASKLVEDGFKSELQLARDLTALENAKLGLETVKITLAKSKLSAPIPGILEERFVEIGDYVDIGDPLATLIDFEQYIVRFQVSETDIGKISLGQSAEALLLTGRKVSGIIRYISPQADPDTRTYLAELLVEVGKDKFPPLGLTSQVVVPGLEMNAVAVSPSLLTLDEAGDLGIKIVNAASRVQFVPVDITYSNSNSVWVVGLDSSVDVIVVGQGFVKAGDKVAVKTQNSTSGKSLPPTANEVATDQSSQPGRRQ